MHQTLLLFVSGRWARIVPTSWEVLPNALSAMLQYLTLEWPAENGWVNYSSLQPLMYFLVVFVAAPLAAITGVRMSEWSPERDRPPERTLVTEVRDHPAGSDPCGMIPRLCNSHTATDSLTTSNSVK